MTVSDQKPSAEGNENSRRLGDQDLDTWRERVANIPDLRLAKVMRIRRAIITHCYEEEAVLEKAIGNLHNDIGVLCRAGRPEHP
jgi:hypothetical protein